MTTPQDANTAPTGNEEKKEEKAAPKQKKPATPKKKKPKRKKAKKEKAENPRAHKVNAKKEAFITALKECMGVITLAADACDIGRTTVYKWIREDEAFKAEVDSITEVTLDFVESKLLENIQNNDVTSIIFYLKTKGKKRGYIEKQEFGITGDEVNKVKRVSIVIDQAAEKELLSDNNEPH